MDDAAVDPVENSNSEEKGFIMQVPTYLVHCILLCLSLGVCATATTAAQESTLRSVVGMPYAQPDTTAESEATRSLMSFRVGASAVVLDEQGHLLTLEEALPDKETIIGSQLTIIIPGGPEAKAEVIRKGETSLGFCCALKSMNNS